LETEAAGRQLYPLGAFCVADLIFTAHARDQMRARQVPEAAVYHVVENADDVSERDDGCSEYTGVWEGQTIFVVACGEAEPYRVRTVIDRTRRRRR
jgi:hypothetical protein